MMAIGLQLSDFVSVDVIHDGSIRSGDEAPDYSRMPHFTVPAPQFYTLTSGRKLQLTNLSRCLHTACVPRVTVHLLPVTSLRYRQIFCAKVGKIGCGLGLVSRLD